MRQSPLHVTRISGGFIELIFVWGVGNRSSFARLSSVRLLRVDDDACWG